MSGPFMYTPLKYERTPYFPSSPHFVTTPFIPDLTLYPPSPYSNSGSPNRGFVPLPEDPTSPTQYEFPTLSPYDTPYNAPWGEYQRERRPSWQRPHDQNPWPQASRLYPDGAAVQRRHSFGATGYRPPYLEPGLMSPDALFTPLFINPWIDAESPRLDFYLDLALSELQPVHIYGNGESMLLPEDEAFQPVTQPPLTRLRIVFDAFPEWPCDIEKDQYTHPGPITLIDVLFNVHRHLHQRISSTEYALLTTRGKTSVSRAFTKRCSAIPDVSDEERADGLKRVDYLLGRTRMVGLLRVGRISGMNVMNFVVAK
ncbi:hypothetical protein C0991_010868 [Blastosporella zonata]|nr:hypothetical protein C0991_010868 [Blastosporella zonata]